LVEGNEGFSLDLQLQDLRFFGPELFDELSSVGVGLKELSVDALGLTSLEGMGVECFFESSK
jgi:hypothetical protein